MELSGIRVHQPTISVNRSGSRDLLWKPSSRFGAVHRRDPVDQEVNTKAAVDRTVVFVLKRLTPVWHLVEYPCMDLQDKILSAVLDVQADVKEIKDRLEKVEDVQERTFDKLDGFMLLVNRHEAEIPAVRSHIQRLEERVHVLEASRA